MLEIIQGKGGLMWKCSRIPGLLLLAAAVLAGCRDQQITAPEPQAPSWARVLQNGEFEEPCGTPGAVALRNAAGEQVGGVSVWNGPTIAYVRLTAPEGWEFTEVRVGGGRQPGQFPQTGGKVNPNRFRFGSVIIPPQQEAVIAALHLGNPYNVQPGDEVLISVFARLRPVEADGGEITAWGEGTQFRGGEHPMYFRYTVQTCPPTGPSDRLPGDPNDPAAGAIPNQPFVARGVDYSPTHPELPGVYLSFNTLLLTLRLEATVAEANSLLAQIGAQIVGGIPGKPDEAAGILFLRVPTVTHEEMISLLETLDDHPDVEVAVQDVLLEPQRTTGRSGSVPAGWTWESKPSGGNWGLELIRAPQMWNWNAAVQKGKVPEILTMVIDAGFTASGAHPDLQYDSKYAQKPGTAHYHGTHVAGIIGAGFDNNTGIDGINPFARLLVRASQTKVEGDSPLARRASWGEGFVSQLDSLLRSQPQPRVVNMSMGYAWTRAGIDANKNTAARKVAAKQGVIFGKLLDNLVAKGYALPLLLTAAGNESKGGQLDAKYGSPMNNAALVQGKTNIIVVEADSLTSTNAVVRSDFSNIRGDISAPGSQILSTDLPPELYGRYSGTSMAAPHVAGLAGFLLAIDPGLSNAQLRELLLGNSVPVAGGASNRIDAFAAVMDIDRLRNNPRVLRMLVDVDDGTLDGNQRWDPVAKQPVHTEDADGDGGPGDGRVDMRDFRRWRDWLLQVETPTGLDLDGGNKHPKKDLNGDGDAGVPSDSIYPRGDFNGDGILSRSATRAVGGKLAGQAVTDLQVLQYLFEDTLYNKAELPGLINSGDLTLNTSECLALPRAVKVRSSIRRKGNQATLQMRTHTKKDATQIYTAPVWPAGYTARIEALDQDGQVLANDEKDFTLLPGGDAYWRPDCKTALAFYATGILDGPSYPEVLVRVDLATGGISVVGTRPSAWYGDGFPEPVIDGANRRAVMLDWINGAVRIVEMSLQTGAITVLPALQGNWYDAPEKLLH
ncbi:MAG: S8 family peptidase [Longimicrobiaceae bacterium]